MTNCTRIRAMQRKARKATDKQLRNQLGIPKCFVQHARRYGADVQSIVQTSRQFK